MKSHFDGLSFEIPSGYEIQTRSRSGLAWKHGLTIANTPGTIDADYRGEVKILLLNLGEEPMEIRDQERIAQCVLAPVIQAHWIDADDLSATERGAEVTTFNSACYCLSCTGKNYGALKRLVTG